MEEKRGMANYSKKLRQNWRKQDL
uniref:Uncharacterized protein n=1 Tax=Anguilla anguilla TaxID=7936 RepID=A0A0E9XVM1_ANGAN